MKNIFKHIWNRHQERKAESETFNEIWRDHYDTILKIEKKESWMTGFLFGFLFCMAFTAVIFFALKYLI